MSSGLPLTLTGVTRGPKGKRQDTLIHAVQLNNEISAKGKGIPSAVEREKAEIKFPRFVPSEASFDVDPPNVIPTKAYKRRKGN